MTLKTRDSKCESAAAPVFSKTPGAFCYPRPRFTNTSFSPERADFKGALADLHQF
jgi:hypothetical protein